jgi:hypothetical protein
MTIGTCYLAFDIGNQHRLHDKSLIKTVIPFHKKGGGNIRIGVISTYFYPACKPKIQAFILV